MQKKVRFLVGLIALNLSVYGYSNSIEPRILALQFPSTLDFQYPRDNFDIVTLKHIDTSYRLDSSKAISVKSNSTLITVGDRKLYPTNIEGIGVALKIENKDVIAENGQIQNLGYFSEQISLSADLVIYKKLLSGIYSLNQQTIAMLQMGEKVSDLSPINVLPTNIQVKQKSCELINKNQLVNLKTIGVTDLLHKNSEVYGGTFSLQLACDQSVSAYITFWDQTDYSNKTSILNLSRDSTAKGVGLRIYKNDDAVTFGNEWLFTKNEDRVSQTFSVNYMNLNGKISPGTVNAVATVTFSYR